MTYFANNRTRLRYAKYRDLDLQIGSGTMESGCKQLGSERLKIAGTQWGEQRIRFLAKARAAYLNGKWEEFTAPLDQLYQVA